MSLRSNRYAFGMDQDGGAVLVDSVEEMAAAIDKLLAVPEQLQSLSSRAVATARAQMDWSAFVARIGEVLDRPVARPGRRIGAEVGRVVERFTDHLQEQLEGVRDELGRSEARAHGLAEEVAILRVESEERATALRRSAAEGQALREQLAQAQSTLRRLAALERRRSVRLALRLAEPFRPLFRLRDRLRARRGRS